MSILPTGFHINGSKAGLKKSGKFDLGAIWSDQPLAWALTATTNLVRAISVDRNREVLASGTEVRGVLVNSGNANCSTGEEGAANNVRMAVALANAIGCNPDEVLTASTGVIGQQMPIGKLEAGVPALIKTTDGLEEFSRAILTTDLSTKVATRTLASGAVVTGIAKGSGMIHPNMATMLGFILTDAAVPTADLRHVWSEVVEDSFNLVTVDGDESTNDIGLLLSSQRVPSQLADFADAVLDVAQELAQAIASDGEGATKLINVTVIGAASKPEARLAARAIAGSSLVKTAVHGADPNWGRIIAAAGRSGATFDQALANVRLQGVSIYAGKPLPFDAVALSEKMQSNTVNIVVDLQNGEAATTAWGCDLSRDYVRINADYTT